MIIIRENDFSHATLSPHERYLAKILRPGRFKPGDLPVHRALGIIRPWQVARADHELVDDLPAGENKSLLQDLNAITTRKASYFQWRSFSNRHAEIISNTKEDA